MTEADKEQQGQKRKKWDTLDDVEDAALAKKLFGVSYETPSSDEEPELEGEGTFQTAASASKAVWEDEDDLIDEDVELPKKRSAVFLKKSTDGSEKIKKREYQERLKAHFVRTHNAGKIPTWAKSQKTAVALHEDDSDDEVSTALKIMTRSAIKYTVKSEFLPKNVIQTTLLPDITVGHSNGKHISVLRFHKAKNVLLTADYGGSVKLFEIDSEAKKEHFLQKIHFTRFPIGCMDFVGGDSVICGSKRKEFLMLYNFVSGKIMELRLPSSVCRQGTDNFAISTDGKVMAMAGYSNQVHLISTSTMEHIQTVSVSSPIASLTFLPESNSELWIICENGEVNYWKTTSCSLHSFIDNGSIHGTNITFTENGQYLACGSNSGIVNIYDSSEARLSTNPKPVAVNKSLLTSCNSLAFNHDGQLLASGSSAKSNQLKLFHMRSQTVFSNFPQHFEKIPCSTCVQFSPHSAYLAVGCENGRLRLYRVSHFNDY